MRVTQADSTLWERLKNAWEEDGQPGYVVLGNTTYQVIRLSDTIEFERMDNQAMYSSLSIGGR